jgi:hypothetical protein
MKKKRTLTLIGGKAQIVFTSYFMKLGVALLRALARAETGRARPQRAG